MENFLPQLTHLPREIWSSLQHQLTPQGYLFWLLIVSLAVLLLERLRPWRREQPLWRPQLGQDVVYLVINGWLGGLIIALLLARPFQQFYRGAEWCCLTPEATPHLLAGFPLWLQVLVFLVVKDFLEYVIHYLLHRVPLLWRLHQLHHSITTMDWIGNFRFHYGEVLVYDLLKWAPMILLRVDPHVILAVGVFSTLIGHLNHSNLPLGHGPLRYVFNSPRMHLWHHDVIGHRSPYGQNFAVIFSAWDWIFGTASWPADREGPERLGFLGQRSWYPRGLGRRLLAPFVPRRLVREKAPARAG
jgi:sterol desaturase/sphingolipid hydroxylase (fatty acid hydroxylase superfamily)